MDANFELLTLQGLANQLGLSHPTARRMRKRGLLTPDFEASGSYLFDPSRVDSLRAVIAEARSRNPEQIQPIL